MARGDSPKALTGDVAFVKGSIPKVFDVSIGASYHDKGVDNAEHDFFGITIQVPLSLVAGTRTIGAGTRAASCSASHDICFERGAEQAELRVARDSVAHVRAQFFAY